MTYRQTFVIEYPDLSHASRVDPRIETLGGKLVAVQFNDALKELEDVQEELEALRDCCAIFVGTDDAIKETEKLLAERRARRSTNKESI